MQIYRYFNYISIQSISVFKVYQYSKYISIEIYQYFNTYQRTFINASLIK
jgi:hypothetical protein